MEIDKIPSKYGADGDILIGHSMGGLVAREIERKHPNNIRGVITVGTPNRGLYLLNNNRIDYIFNYLQTESESYRTQYGVPTDLSKYLSQVDLIKRLAESPASKNMKVGSVFMNTLEVHSKNNATPLITIRGHEESPTVYRLAGSFLNKNKRVEEENFEYDDKSILKIIEDTKHQIETARIRWAELLQGPGLTIGWVAGGAIGAPFGGVGAIVGAIVGAVVGCGAVEVGSRVRASAIRAEVSNKFDNIYPNKWLEQISEYEWRYTTVTYSMPFKRSTSFRSMTSSGHKGAAYIEYDIPSDKDRGRTTRRIRLSSSRPSRTRRAYYKYYRPNDGLISDYRAQSEQQDKTFVAAGANHMEMHNNENTYNKIVESLRHLK